MRRAIVVIERITESPANAAYGTTMLAAIERARVGSRAVCVRRLNANADWEKTNEKT